MDFACKTATFGAELQVSVGPRPHLSFCTCKTAWWDSGSIGPSPYLCFLHAKQRLLEQNYKSLWVPDLMCGFWMQSSNLWTGITRLYESQTEPVVLCLQNSVIAPECQVYIGSSSHLCFFSCKTTTLWPDLQVCMGPRPHLWFWANITAWLVQE